MPTLDVSVLKALNVNLLLGLDVEPIMLLVAVDVFSLIALCCWVAVVRCCCCCGRYLCWIAVVRCCCCSRLRLYIYIYGPEPQSVGKKRPTFKCSHLHFYGKNDPENHLVGGFSCFNVLSSFSSLPFLALVFCIFPSASWLFEA